MSSRAYIIAEGVHDVAFLGKLLEEALQFKRVMDVASLDEAWKILLPAWPHKGSLRPSVPAPSFYQSAPHGVSVAIVNAQGLSEMSKRLRVHVDALQREGIRPDAVGAVLDADSDKDPPEKRFARMAQGFVGAGLPSPAIVQEIAGSPRVGVFILPGDGARGTLEDLLLECAALVYPTLGCRAVRFVDGLDRAAPDFASGELNELGKPAGRHKAVVAAMGAVLRPGKPIQATLEDHRWIGPPTLARPRIKALLGFLANLLGVPAEAPAEVTGV